MVKTAARGFMKESEYMFERFVTSVRFSSDDKGVTVVLRNGPTESIVRSYDYLITKGKFTASKTFEDQLISDALFYQADKNQVIVAGEDVFKLYKVNIGQKAL